MSACRSSVAGWIVVEAPREQRDAPPAAQDAASSDATRPRMSEVARSAARARAVTRMFARARARSRVLPCQAEALPGNRTTGGCRWALQTTRSNLVVRDAVSVARARPNGTATRAERFRRATRDARRSASAPSPTPHRARDPVARPRRRHLLVSGERGTCRHRRRTRRASAGTHPERRRAGGDPTSGAMGFFSFLMSFMASKKTKVRARRAPLPRRPTPPRVPPSLHETSRPPADPPPPSPGHSRPPLTPPPPPRRLAPLPRLARR